MTTAALSMGVAAGDAYTRPPTSATTGGLSCADTVGPTTPTDNPTRTSSADVTTGAVINPRATLTLSISARTLAVNPAPLTIVAAVAQADDLVHAQGRDAALLKPPHVRRIHAVIAHADQRVDRDALVAELRHRAHVLGIDAVVAREDDVVGRQLREAVRRHSADVFRIDAVIAEADQRVDGAETVAECRHVLDVPAVGAVLRRADKRAKVRRRVAGGGQRVEIRDADVGDGEIELVL